MIYLVDASVIITAKDYYYQLDRVPEFWEWLSYWGEQGKIRIPKEIMFEITQDSGILGKWIKERKNLFLIDEEIQNVNYVLMNGYDLTLDEIDDIQIAKVGKDPFLISYGLTDKENRAVVSTESSKPSKQKYNKKIPDVCSQLGIKCFDIYRLIKDLDFRTNWKTFL